MIDLLEYCKTDRQRVVIQAVIDQGGQRKAAVHLKVVPGTVTSIVATVKKYAAIQGHSPAHDKLHGEVERHTVNIGMLRQSIQ